MHRTVSPLRRRWIAHGANHGVPDAKLVPRMGLACNGFMMKLRQIEFETTDPDRAVEFLASAYGTGLRTGRLAGGDRLRHRRLEAGGFAVDTMHLPLKASWTVDPLGCLVVARVDGGRVERECGGVSNRYRIGDVYLVADPALPYRGHTDGTEAQTSMLDMSVFAQVVDSTPGRVPRPVRFTGFEPVSAAAGRLWANTCVDLTSMLANPAAAGSLVASNAARLMAAVVLATFPNTAVSEPTIEDRHDASAGCLRRAVSFIESNADRDIGAADIAAAAGVTIRAVQLAFRRHLDTTPMAYLRRVRLACVHEELRSADPTRRTVTAVAARWGFGSASRFSAYYRAAYGVPPSATLRD